MLERRRFPELSPRPPDRRCMAARLQPPPAAHEPRRPHPERVRTPVDWGPDLNRTLVMIECNQGARSPASVVSASAPPSTTLTCTLPSSRPMSRGEPMARTGRKVTVRLIAKSALKPTFGAVRFGRLDQAGQVPCNKRVLQGAPVRFVASVGLCPAWLPATGHVRRVRGVHSRRVP